jgi:hypothetical protein
MKGTDINIFTVNNFTEEVFKIGYHKHLQKTGKNCYYNKLKVPDTIADT